MSIPNLKDTSRVLIMIRGLFKFFPLLLLPVFAVVVPSSVFAQKNIHVKGQIVNETGLAIAKASVIIKGASDGVTSDDNGNYEITVPSNGILVFSYVGLYNC